MIRNEKNRATELPPLEEHSALEVFHKQDAAAAALLLVAAAAALIVANSPAHDWYHDFWEQELGIVLGGAGLRQSLHYWINDGLMAIFFFLVGLEIKREVLVGQLASFRRALLPAVAAVGGMVVPALIYTALNWGEPTARGWGIPMATDIAFAAGCLSLLGRRLLPSMRIFLVALAIVDDLGSVLVIAVFYTEQIAAFPLAIGGILVVLSFGLNRLGVRRTLPYAVIGVIVWIAFLRSGVHATIAGVLLALTIPAGARYETPHFSGRMKTLLDRFVDAEDHVHPFLVNARQQDLIRHMLRECLHVEAPLQRIEHFLHPLSVLVILPLFAFANSGVALDIASIGHVFAEPVTLGVVFGLLAGKQIGITLGSWVAVKLGWASLPEGMRWVHVYGLSWIAAIGFTMALFISELAFKHSMPQYLEQAKVAVFTASITAGLVGLAILRFCSDTPEKTS